MNKRAVALACCVSILTPAASQAQFLVSTTSGDASAGSLGSALANASPARAAINDTITFDALFNTPKTITLTAPYSAVIKNAGVSLSLAPATALTLAGGGLNVFNFSGGGTLNLASITVDNGAVSLGANSTIAGGLGLTGSSLAMGSGAVLAANTAITGVNTFTTAAGASSITGKLTGTGTLATAGAGTLTLTDATNAFSGGLTATGGVVSASAAGQLGSGTITLNGATLKTTVGMAAANAVVVTGASTFEVSGVQTTTLSGGMSGAGSLTKTGLGVLSLTAASMYTGDTAINAGTLNFGMGNLTYNGAITGTGTLTKTIPGILTFGGVGTFAGNVEVHAGTMEFANAAGTTLSGNVSGAGVLRQAAGGTLTLSGATMHTGGTIVNGILNLASSANIAYDGSIGGAGTVTKTGAGVLTLSGNNAGLNGNLSISNGVVSVAAANSLGNAVNGTIVLEGGTLRTTAGFVTAKGFSVGSGGGTLDAAAGQTTNLSGVFSGLGTLTKAGLGNLSLTGSSLYSGNTVINGGALDFASSTDLAYGGAITGAGAVTKTGTGVLTLTGANTFTGPLTISGGILSVGNDNQLGSLAPLASVALAGGTLRTTTGITSARAIALTGTGTLSVNAGQTTTLNGVVSETVPSALTVTGGGTLALGNALNTYSGGTTVTGGAILRIDANGNLGNTSGGVTLNNGTLTTNAAITTARPLNLAGAGTLSVGALGTTWNGTISGAGLLTKSGIGMLDMTGSTNNSTGGLLFQNGTFRVNSAAQLGAAGGLTFDGGTLQTTTGITTSKNVAVNSSGVASVSAGQTTTFNGAISGAGTLNVTGGGTLSLAGATGLQTGQTAVAGGSSLKISADAELGATNMLTLDNGTLKSDFGITSARALALGAGGGTLDVANAQTFTWSGLISGAGGLTKANAGTLVLGNAGSSFSGGLTATGGVVSASAPGQLGSGAITLNGATLRTTAGLTAANAVSLGAGGGTLDISAAQTTTLSGLLNGAGTLTKASAGTLSLTGGLTGFSGAVDIAAGILDLNPGADATFANNISGAGALKKSGANILTLTGANIFTGGLEVAAGRIKSASLSGNANLSGGEFEFTNAASAAYGGVMSGAGAMIKSGAGTLTMSNTNTYTGATTIAQGGVNLTGSLGGPVTVANGATLSGGGTVNGSVTSSGVMRPSTAMLIAGDFTATGTNVLSVGASGDMLTVNGSSNLGGTVLVTAPSAPVLGTVWTVLTSATSLNGTFSTLQLPAGMLAALSYTANAVRVTWLTPTSFGATPGLTGSQGSLARFLDRIGGGSPEMAAAMTRLGALPAADFKRALDQMTPASLGGALGGMSFSGAGAQSGAAGQRMAGLRTGDARGEQASYFVTNEQDYHGLLLASAPGDVENLAPKPSPSKWGVFVSGLGTFGRLDARTDANGTTPGYGFTTGGGTAGVDYRFSDSVIGGLTAGFTNNSASLDSSGGSVTGRSIRFGGYGSVYGDDAYGALYLGGASDSYDSTRNITPLSLVANSKPKATELNVDLTAGLTGWTFDGGRLSPFVGLAYDRVATGAFSETGAGAMNLNVSAITAESLRSTLGARISKRIGAFAPYASAAWRREHQSQSRAIDAQFSTGGSFTTHTADVARDGAALSAGLDAELGRGWSSKLGYAGDFRAGFRAHTVNGDLRLKF